MNGTEFAMGAQLIEMADKVLFIDKFTPGSEARWGFVMDGVPFSVSVKVSREDKEHA